MIDELNIVKDLDEIYQLLASSSYKKKMPICL